MNFAYNDTQREICAAVAGLCEQFGPEYWRSCDADQSYPEAFVQAMSEGGWLAALIPEEYGGSGLSLLDACLILQSVNGSGANGAACHAQMYTMASLLNHGSDEQKRKYLPKIADGSVRLQAFGVTEPDAGSNTLAIKTFAKKVDGGFLINGQKIWTSRFRQSHLYLLLARTTPQAEISKKTDGLTLFLVDIAAAGDALKSTKIETILNHHTYEVFIEDLFVADDAVIGTPGRGFHYILDSLNAERLLVASECIGDGYWVTEQASKYASERRVFDRPIGSNQGVQFPVAKAYTHLLAAEALRNRAADAVDGGQPIGQLPTIAKYLSSEAAWEAADAAMTTFGGYGLATEYHIERKWKEARLFRTAPLANTLILAQVAQHSLGMPRSY